MLSASPISEREVAVLREMSSVDVARCLPLEKMPLAGASARCLDGQCPNGLAMQAQC